MEEVGDSKTRVNSGAEPRTGAAGLSLPWAGLAFVRPPVYHSGDDFSQWLAVYESACSSNNWPDSMKISYLPMALPRDSSLQLAAAEADKTSSFELVVKELRSMLTVHEPHEKLAKFDSRELQAGEKVGEFERALRVLYKAALGSQADPDSDPRYIKKFIGGLPQRWRFQIASKMYRSVSGSHGALAHAQNLEAAEALHGPLLDNRPYFPVAVAQPSSGFDTNTQLQMQVSPLSEVDQLRSRLVKLEQDARQREQDFSTQMGQLTSMMRDLLGELREGRGVARGQCRPTVRRRSRSVARSFSRDRSGSTPRFFCSFCRKHGHTVDRCFARQDMRCFRCDAIGHRASDCQHRVDSDRQPNVGTFRSPAGRGQEN